jgi:hypothetical protein
VVLVDDGRQALRFDGRFGVDSYVESSGCSVPAAPASPAAPLVKLALEPCGEFYGEAVYASRFDHNTVVFARPRGALTYLVTGPLMWQATVEVRGAVDANGDYYNNFSDAGLGHRFRLVSPVRVDALVSAHRGTYLGRSHLDPLPSSLGYTELRFQAATYVEF